MRKGSLALLLAVGGCFEPQGSPTPPRSGAGAAVVLVTGYSFQPNRLEVHPGSTVVVENHDGVAHGVTSTAAAGSFTPGAVPGAAAFETGAIPGGQLSAFSIPADVPVGAVLPYYCGLHRLPSEQGELVVVAP